MPHSTSTDNSVLLDKRVFFDSGALFGVKVRRYYHASRRSSEIDRKKQRYLFFFSGRSCGRPIPYDLEHRLRILRAIVVNLFSETHAASGGEGNIHRVPEITVMNRSCACQ